MSQPLNKEQVESVLEALKVAFLFMPEPKNVTRYEYGSGRNYSIVKSDVNMVRKTLQDIGIDPDALYEQRNPIVS